MAGQVDVIVSKQAINEIKVATAKLEKLRLKILQVNKASAKGGSGGIGGIGDNKAITDQLAGINKLIAANNKLTVSANKKLNAIKKNTAAMKKSTNQMGKATTSAKGFGAALKTIGITIIAMKALQFGKHIFSLAKTFDSLRFAMEKTSSSLSEAAFNTRFMLNLSKELGLDLVSATTRFIKFAAAARNSGVALKDTQKIFKTMAKAGSVLGLRTDELGGVFLALEQMLSKGKVTTEELRRQLGERLPGAFGIMAASLDVTLPKLDEMLKAGEILSADVLPGFADAVEIAFGLDTVNTIDTLVAAENRMSTSWQDFIKNITGSESFIKKVFKGILNVTRESIDEWNEMVNPEVVERDRNLNASFKLQTDIIEKQAQSIVDLRRDKSEQLIAINKETKAAELHAEGRINDNAAQDRVRLAVAAELKFNKELQIEKQKIAEGLFQKEFDNVQLRRKAVTDAEATLFDAKQKNTTGKGRNSVVSVKETREANEALTEQIRLLQIAQGSLDATRLLAEKSKPADKLDPKKKTAKIDTSDIDANIAGLKKLQEIQRQGVEDEDKTFDQRLANQTAFFATSNAISEANLEKGERLAGDDHDKQKIAQLKHDTETLKLIDKSQKDVISLTQSFLDGQLKEAQSSGDEVTNILIRQIKESYALMGDLTKKEEKRLNKEIATVKREGNNATLLAQAELIRDFLDAMKLDGKVRIALEREIEAKLAGIKGKGGSDEPEKEKEEGDPLVDSLRKAAEFADAIEDLGNAIFDAKIARIDEEIRREEEKYALLFAFAEGDANQTRLLAIQEAEDRAKLEKKRREVVKKQAKFNKAAALVEIAINTAIAISQVSPNPLLIVLASALGALQIATVLAQPIPQFAEGGIMKNDGLALVGDGGRKEVMRTPDGKISVTPATDTIVNIPKGTEIFPSIADFNNEQPSDLDAKIYSATLLASISLNQKNIEGMMFSQKELDERLLDEMIKNTRAVRESKSSVHLKTQSIDIPHQMWKNKFLS